MGDWNAINWLAVFVCMLICVISGSLWYNPKTFFMTWWRGIGKTAQDVPGAGSNMKVVFGLTFVSSFIQPLVMAHILPLVFPNGATAWQGMLIGFVLWLGFTAPTALVNHLFAGHRWYAWVIETSNHLLNFVLFGLILAVWR